MKTNNSPDYFVNTNSYMFSLYKHQPEYTDALAFAGRAHRNQKRKYDGKSYISHPMSVAGIVMRYIPDYTTEMIHAALLHDVVEDTDTTIEQVNGVFGPKVAEYVNYLTDVSVPSDGNRKFRKNLDAEWNGKGPPESQNIKLADLIHNSVDIQKNDKKFWKLYRLEKLYTIQQLTKSNSQLKAIARSIVL